VVDLCGSDSEEEPSSAGQGALASRLSPGGGAAAAKIVNVPARIVEYDDFADKWVFRLDICDENERCDGCEECEHGIESHATKQW
jgi:hypothetical protein